MTMPNTMLKHSVHDRCSCELRKVGPHVGLYCKPHKHWFKWLTNEEIVVCVNSGLKLATTPNRDKLSLKDNHTINNRIKRQKRWKQHKANTGSL